MRLIILICIAILIGMVTAQKNETIEHSKGEKVVIKKTKIEGDIEDGGWKYLTNNIILVTTNKELYLSVNKGDTWEALNEKLCQATTCIDHYKVSKVDPKRIYFRGTMKGGEAWIIPDITQASSVKTFEQMVFPEARASKLVHFDFHPTDANRGLLITQHTSDVEGHRTLWQTYDGGKSWKKVMDHIKSAFWLTTKAAHYNPNKIIAIHLQHHSNENVGRAITINVEQQYARPLDHGITHAKNLLLEDKFFFVGTNEKVRDMEVTKLHVSSDNGLRFRKVLTPQNLPPKHFTIVDTAEGSVFININQVRDKSKSWGHVFHSDPSGARYSSSLDYNRVSGPKSVDFHRVLSLEGVYIANVVTNLDDPKCSKCSGYIQCNKACKFGTRITFDKGTNWGPLSTKTCDDDVKLQSGACPLHLHGFASAERTPILSQKDSVGMVLASGNVGAALSTDGAESLGVFLSRDGGLNWNQIENGDYIYGMSDHGGIIVLAPSGQLTDVLRYTYNEGSTWDNFPLGDDYRVHRILHSNNQLAKKFILEVENSKRERYLLQIDFSLIHTKNCKPPSSSKIGSPESDYEYWTPHSYESKCLLGRKITYVRRKQDAACFNMIPFEKPHKIVNCPCDYVDYQCDYGYYEFAGTDGHTHCKRDDEFISRPPDECYGYYNDSRGYVRIAGDSCVPNEISEKLDPIRKKCLPTIHFSSAIILVAFIALLCALCTSIMYNNSPAFRNCIRSCRRRKPKEYTSLPTTAHESDEDSDLGILIDGPSKRQDVGSSDDDIIDESKYSNSPTAPQTSNIQLTTVKEQDQQEENNYHDDDFEDDAEFVKAP